MDTDGNSLRHAIKSIRQMADTALFSDHPWRAAYINTLADQAQDLLSKGKEKTAAALYQNLKKTTDQWHFEKSEQKTGMQDNNKNSAKPEINSLITEYLKSRNKPLPKDTKNPWNTYRNNSLEEIEKWDACCSETLSRIRISQCLDFSDHDGDAWGPYNTKYNVMEALKRLSRFDQEWLESYLLLYESFQRIE